VPCLSCASVSGAFGVLLGHGVQRIVTSARGQLAAPLHRRGLPSPHLGLLCFEISPDDRPDTTT